MTAFARIDYEADRSTTQRERDNELVGWIEREFSDLPESTRGQIPALLGTLSSARTWYMLTSGMGLSHDEAADVADGQHRQLVAAAQNLDRD